ncbi:MAG: hypothetical protein R3326_03810 [Gemmatimonadota bacterium]|nr:hypothetical protein [Gemmatimonadota bacterium]
MGTIQRQWKVLIVLAVATACGGSDGGGPTTPDGPDIRGTYTGSPPAGHTFSIQFLPDDPASFSCPGAVVVSSSSGGSFGGTFRIDPCALAGIQQPVPLSILSGTVQEDGSIRFQVEAQDAIIQGLQEEGCDELEVDEAFTGTVSGGSFAAAIEGRFDCPDPEVEGERVTVVVRWSFEGTSS